ncbi:MAG: DUF1996 domain-containing protein, partial [Actinomycetota bacterium]
MRKLNKRVLFAVLVFGLALTGLPSAADHGTEDAILFTVFCDFSHQNRDDPIVYPGQPGAAHLHHYIGAKDAKADSTYASMQAGGTTCEQQDDTAGYWFPAMIGPDGEPLPPTITFAYYYGFQGQEISAYPPGLKILGGTADPAVSLGTAAAEWRCGGQHRLPRIPDCSTSAISAIVTFRDCWDGVRLDSPDHVGHMARSGSDKICPSTHPTRVPALSLSIVWPTGPNARTNGYHLSSDMGGAEPGETLHADFWNTWDQPTLERLVKTCLVDHNDAPESAAEPGCRRVASGVGPAATVEPDPGRLANAGFESGTLSGWTVASGTWSTVTSEKNLGSHAAELRPTSSGGGTILQKFSVVGGDINCASAHIKVEDKQSYARAEVRYFDAANKNVGLNVAAVDFHTFGGFSVAEWKQVQETQVVPPNAVRADFMLAGGTEPDNDGAAWFDDASFRPGACAEPSPS